MRMLECLRCGREMRYARREKIQLGEQGVLSSHWAHLMAGALEVDIYYCAECGKMEFFTPAERREHPADPNAEFSEEDFPEMKGSEFSYSKPPQKKCPRCGMTHDFDYPKCPGCNFDYYAD